jgi:hypothetical protein
MKAEFKKANKNFNKKIELEKKYREYYKKKFHSGETKCLEE